MGLLGILMNLSETFSDDPTGSVSNAVSDGVSYMNDRCNAQYERIRRVCEKRARAASNEELRRYADKARREGNTLGMDVARKEMERRHMR